MTTICTALFVQDIVCDDFILAQERDDQDLDGVWPIMGKVEADELPEHAVIREASEEVLNWPIGTTCDYHGVFRSDSNKFQTHLFTAGLPLGQRARLKRKELDKHSEFRIFHHSLLHPDAYRMYKQIVRNQLKFIRGHRRLDRSNPPVWDPQKIIKSLRKQLNDLKISDQAMEVINAFLDDESQVVRTVYAPFYDVPGYSSIHLDYSYGHPRVWVIDSYDSVIGTPSS